jgi:anti-anti-sigma factor
MAIENWSENVAVVRLGDDPQFSEDMQSLNKALESRWYDVVLDFSQVEFLNSSNLGSMLRLRKRMIDLERRLVLCGLKDQVWGALLVTGLDKVFDFSDDVATGLATLHMGKVG